ncbi:hypothetical protein EGR_09043 [Echinococcus granulosus]|nr:hypothetical protein EGR_09043 [Echinococcus granulosus]EUB56104.1 hypothetical protein EGR_09043 [Echinococcus granulosus]
MVYVSLKLIEKLSEGPWQDLGSSTDLVSYPSFRKLPLFTHCEQGPRADGIRRRRVHKQSASFQRNGPRTRTAPACTLPVTATSVTAIAYSPHILDYILPPALPPPSSSSSHAPPSAPNVSAPNFSSSCSFSLQYSLLSQNLLSSTKPTYAPEKVAASSQLNSPLDGPGDLLYFTLPLSHYAPIDYPNILPNCLSTPAYFTTASTCPFDDFSSKPYSPQICARPTWMGERSRFPS